MTTRSLRASAAALIPISFMAAAQPPRSARAAAPADLTGNWVALVTEDWRWRMITPPRGDHASVPLNAEGRKAADTWDLAKDAAAGAREPQSPEHELEPDPNRVSEPERQPRASSR